MELPEGELHPPELWALGIREYRQLEVGRYRLIYRLAAGEVQVLLLCDRGRSLQSLLQRRLLES